MGPIQQATNQLLQSGAAVATVGKHFINQKKRDALSALETTESLSNEYKETSKQLERGKYELEQSSEAEAKAKANLESAKAATKASNENIEAFKSNTHPKRDNGQFMSSDEKKSKLEELYEKHKLLERDQGIADAAWKKSAADLSAINEQTEMLDARYKFLQQKKSLVRDMLPSAYKDNLDKQFDKAGKFGTAQGELDFLLSKSKKNKGDNK